MRISKLILACVVVAAVFAITPRLLCAADKPNIVLLFIDDWAWNGSPVPMDDALANIVHLKNGYAKLGAIL